MDDFERLVTVGVKLLLGALLVVLLAGYLRDPLFLRAQGVSHFSNVTVSGTVQAEELISTDDATITDSLAAANLALSGLRRESAGSAVTVTQDSAILPVASVQYITAAGAVSTSSITALTAGTWVTLYNSGSNTITISDAGTLKLSGDIALGAGDTLTLWCDGTNWIQTGTSNN
jgi:hypothetical protein